MFTDIEKLKAIVKQAAQDELMSAFGHSDYEYKEDGSVLTPSDIAMQGRLERELVLHWPQYGILGEEMTDEEQQRVITDADARDEGGYWCIDPLDGTSNYAAHIPFFAVSIALIIDREQHLGLIYDPVRDEMFSAIRGEGAFLNDQPLTNSWSDESSIQSANKPVVAEIDLKRLPKPLAVRLVSESMFSSQRNIGSSAMDWCWMAAGRFDIYLHGGQKMWDYAAGSLIFSEAGGRSVSLDGEPVFRGNLEVRSVLASFQQALFDHWHDWITIPYQE